MRPLTRLTWTTLLLSAALVPARAGAAELAPGSTTSLLAFPGTATPVPASTGTSRLLDPGRTVSADGRYAVFVSDADGLVDTDDDRYQGVYRRDLVTGTTILVSRRTGLVGAPAAGPADTPSISSDGDAVAFITAASLVGTDTNQHDDVYVRQIGSGTTSLVSRASGIGGQVADAASTDAEISGDGGTVVFSSAATNLGPATGAAGAVYTRSLAGVTRLVSRTDADAPAGGTEPAIDDDGDRVTFVSAQPLAGEADDGLPDVYVRTTTGDATGDTTLISRATGATGADSNAAAHSPSIDGAGTRVAYATGATNLDPDDGDSRADVYLRLPGAVTTLVSRATGTAGTPCDGVCGGPLVVGEGAAASVVFFATEAPAMLGTGLRVVVRRRIGAASTTAIVSRRQGGPESPVAAGGFGVARTDGDGVAFDSDDDEILPDDDNDHRNVYLRAAGTTSLVSRPSGFAPFVRGLGFSTLPDVGARGLSADGRYVVFASDSDALLPAGAEQGTTSLVVYRRDLLTDTLAVVSSDTAGAILPVSASPGGISADGRYVAFTTTDPSLAQQLGLPGGGTRHAYRRDLATGEIVAVSRTSTGAGLDGHGVDGSVTISGDGNRVAFVSDVAGVAEGQSGTDDHVFVRDVAAGTTVLASRRDGPQGAALQDGSSAPTLDGDGSVVAFETDDDGLDGDGTSAEPSQVVARDLASGRTVVLSRRDPSAPFGSGSSGRPSIDRAGTRVAFGSTATNLDPDDADAARTAYVADLASGRAEAVSRESGAGGAVAAEPAYDAVLSGDGRHVAFATEAALVPGDADGAEDVVVRDLDTGANALGSVGDGNVPLARPSSTAHLSDGARCVAFSSSDGGIAPGSPLTGELSLLAVHALTATCPGAPQTPGPGAPGPGAAATPVPTRPGTRDVTRPALTKLTLLRKRFRVSSRSTAVSAARTPRRPAAGTSIRFTLSERATVLVVVEQVRTGRRSGKRCVAPTKRLRRRAPCTRYVARGSLTRRALAAGRRSLAFSGRIGKRRLPAGTYRLSLTATDPAGNRSTVRRIRATVVR